MSDVKFSILLPTYNRLDLLQKAVSTVQAQDYDNWEVVVSDNCSEEDVGGFIAGLADARIRYVKTAAFVPVTENWSNALKHSSGDYVIMLGDDDGLMPGCLRSLSTHIAAYDRPDAIYTGALLYAYPGVLPWCKDGFLRSYRNRRIYQGGSAPYKLSREDARWYVEQSLNFKVEFDYNMQFFVVSRRIIEQLADHGDFFQSPYPDYYAANVLLLKARDILVLPDPHMIVGISPKSFGYYYFNDAEDDGNKFLNNMPDQAMVDRLKDVVLPGPVMNNSWLIAMETVVDNYGEEEGVVVNRDRYRTIQMLAVLGSLLGRPGAWSKLRQAFAGRLSMGEWLGLVLPAFLRSRIPPGKSPERIARELTEQAASHPAVVMPDVPGRYQDIVDVYREVPADIRPR